MPKQIAQPLGVDDYIATIKHEMAGIYGLATRFKKNMRNSETVANTGSTFVTDASGRQLSWRFWDNSGRLIVLVHGGSGSWTHWVRNIQALTAAGYRVLAPDLPGTGDSQSPAQSFDRNNLFKSSQNLALDVARGLRELDPKLDTREYTLVGFSLGSIVGTSIVHVDRPHASRLVLVGTSGLGLNTVSPGRGLEAPDDADSEREALDKQGRNLRKIMLANDDSIDELAKQLQRDNVSRARLRTHYLGTSGVMLEALPRTRVPVHAIWGDRDVYAMNNFNQSISLLNQLCDLKSVHMLAGGGHWAMFERPFAFNDCLLRILEANKPRND